MIYEERNIDKPAFLTRFFQAISLDLKIPDTKGYLPKNEIVKGEVTHE